MKRWSLVSIIILYCVFYIQTTTKLHTSRDNIWIQQLTTIDFFLTGRKHLINLWNDDDFCCSFSLASRSRTWFMPWFRCTPFERCLLYRLQIFMKRPPRYLWRAWNSVSHRVGSVSSRMEWGSYHPFHPFPKLVQPCQAKPRHQWMGFQQ